MFNFRSSSSPATPYKVAVFPWAVSDDSVNQSLEICSTSTPPNILNNQETEDWPPPPTEEEIQSSEPTCKTNIARARTKNSPHVPPPPPPRSKSLTSGNKYHLHSPVVPDSYAVPYDKLSSTSQLLKLEKPVSDYQDPVDMVIKVNSRTQPDNPRMVLQSFSQNDEPDTSLYAKPIQKEDLSLRFNTHAENSSGSIIPDVVLCSQPAKYVSQKPCNVEVLYAKPVKKKLKKTETVDTELSSQPSEKISVVENDIIEPQTTSRECLIHRNHLDKETGLHSEIMSHFQAKSKEYNMMAAKKADPIYESIDECQEKLNSETFPEMENSQALQTNSGVGISSGSSKMKKKTILAVSSDKIYETYLSLRGNPNVLKRKPNREKNEAVLMNNLKKRYNSQPDISVSESGETKLKDFDTFETKMISENETVGKESDGGASCMHLTVAQRAVSLENGLKESEYPGTPTITATPSFDSLCAVTPLSKKSGSAQSLPLKAGSYESLSTNDSSLLSSRSTLSTVPDEESQLSEYLEDENETPTCAQLLELKESNLKKNYKENFSLDEAIKEKFENGNIPITPGKISAAKHGIDLSVYILKPSKHDDSRSEVDNSSATVSSNSETRDIIKAGNSDTKNSGEPNISHKIFEMQTRLAIKDNFSSGKCMKEESFINKETIQTVHGFNVNSTQKSGNQSSVPSIGVASKTHEAKCAKIRPRQSYQTEAAVEPESKRQCVVGTKIKGSGKELYLETDIDTVIAEKGRFNMKKSKSHSSVEQGSSTVVTEIW